MRVGRGAALAKSGGCWAQAKENCLVGMCRVSRPLVLFLPVWKTWPSLSLRTPHVHTPEAPLLGCGQKARGKQPDRPESLSLQHTGSAPGPSLRRTFLLS